MKIPTYATFQNDEFYNDNLSQVLTNGLSDNGFTIAQQTTENINTLSSSMPKGTMWYDTDTDSFKGLVNGIVKTFTVS